MGTADSQYNPFEEQVIAYLLGRMSKVETVVFLQEVAQNEAKKKYLSDTERLWEVLHIKRIVDDIDIEEEHRHFKHILQERALLTTNTDSAQTPVIPFRISKNTTVKKIVKIAAVAASAAVILFGSYRLMNHQQPSVTPQLVVSTAPVATPLAVEMTEKNDTQLPKEIVLEDGTIVSLYQYSAVHFQKPFAPNKRNIYLTGKAYFKVAKDSLRPFTVFSDNISTTALGTRFFVTSYLKEQTITVRLTEGKVVVKPVQGSFKTSTAQVYLSPGQEVVYDKRFATAQVNDFRKKPAPHQADLVKKENIQDKPSLPSEQGTWYMFNNQSLPDVFDQLEGMFDVEIRYNKAALRKIYFIGKFEKTDSLDTILKTIALVNKLTIKRENNTYIIRK